jgi:hypothetical protein
VFTGTQSPASSCTLSGVCDSTAEDVPSPFAYVSSNWDRSVSCAESCSCVTEAVRRDLAASGAAIEESAGAAGAVGSTGACAYAEAGASTVPTGTVGVATSTSSDVSAGIEETGRVGVVAAPAGRATKISATSARATRTAVEVRRRAGRIRVLPFEQTDQAPASATAERSRS